MPVIVKLGGGKGNIWRLIWLYFCKQDILQYDSVSAVCVCIYLHTLTNLPSPCNKPAPKPQRNGAARDCLDVEVWCVGKLRVKVEMIVFKTGHTQLAGGCVMICLAIKQAFILHGDKALFSLSVVS